LAAFELARETRNRLTIRAMAETAAARLNNTPAVARSAYIHPAVLDLAEMQRESRLELLHGLPPVGPSRLAASERRLLAFLQSAEPSSMPAQGQALTGALRKSLDLAAS